MKSPLPFVVGHQVREVTEWQTCATAPNGEPRDWIAGLSTAAASLRATRSWSLDSPARRFDGEDWWWRASVSEGLLHFGGLATVADVFLDGEQILSSDNMFRSHAVKISRGGELRIRFRALDSLLAQKKPRPRWRAPMVENQQLRWFRTTLLGRTPGWSPPAQVVGPWRPVHLVEKPIVEDLSIKTHASGRVQLSFRSPAASGEMFVSRNGVSHKNALTQTADGLSGILELPKVERWFPHTHGEPALYDLRISLDGLDIDLGKIGFREVAREGDFSLSINGAPLFCRGACWTPLDVVTLSSPREDLAKALTQVRDAGMNMLRVGGTMVYESDDFYQLCDELGILVWQDFMFANLDYPEDEGFLANVKEEARQQVSRLSRHPSLAIWCGNSEIEQQAAMWGASRDRWSPKLFHEILPSLVEDVPYWPSSTHGGAFPHAANSGTTSYYGVGAYLRPLEDARRAEVRFATECLAFANIPEEMLSKVHSPQWKARTPRDLGAGWDFDDVRDFYVGKLFNVDPAALRYADHDRYSALGRAAVGEVMAQVFGEWRRIRSVCRGGLIWFLRDLWPGAGWGVVDANGKAKSAYWYLKRALAKTAVHISDEGGNGLHLHVHHEPASLAGQDDAPTTGELEVQLFRDGEVAVGSAKKIVELPSETPAISLFEGFLDLSYAYRFGPPSCDLVVATIRTENVTAQAFHFPVGLPNRRELDLGLTAERQGDQVKITTRRFAQSIYIDGDADDNWFHLAPGATRTIGVRGGATLQPLNCQTATKIK